MAQKYRFIFHNICDVTYFVYSTALAKNTTSCCVSEEISETCMDITKQISCRWEKIAS